MPQQVGLLAEHADAFQQQVAEIDGVENLQPILVGAVELLSLAAREASGLAGGHLGRPQSTVLPAVEQSRQHPRRPALLIDALRFQQLLEQADLVVDVEDGESGLEPDQLGVPPQNSRADRMECAKPWHSLDNLPHHQADPLLHLLRCLVGEGHCQDLAGPGTFGRKNVRYPRCQNASLAGSGTGQDEHRPVQCLHRQPLLRVQVGEIGRAGRGARARRYAIRPGRRRRGALAHTMLAGIGQRRSRNTNLTHKMAAGAGVCETRSGVSGEW